MTFTAAVGIPVYATIMTWLNRYDIDYPLLAVAALAAVTVASAVLVYGSSPLRAPFSMPMHLMVSAATTLAYVLSSLSMWQSNAHVRDDWGPMVVGVALLSLSQYRPPKEIASVGLSLALFAGVLTLLQAHSFVTLTPPITFALVAMTPILAMSLASATFGRSLIEGLVRWRRQARRAASSFATENSDWIARSVQQDRVTILNQDVVPFFAEVLQRGVIDNDDRERARRISDAIRAVMIAEVDRTWLDTVVEQVAGHATEDPDRLAQQMTTDQRTAIRAIIVAVAGHPAFSARAFSLALESSGGQCAVVMEATLETAANVLRGEIAPYVAVLRIVFTDLKVEFSNTTLTLRFSYEQR
jgi:type IV secretory pathway VirB2 component (pilin)